MNSNHNLVLRHLNNLSRLSYIFEDTTNLLHNYLERNHQSRNRNRRNQMNNDATANINDPSILFRFDTLIPNIFNDLNTLNQSTQDNSYSILMINENNKSMIQDVSSQYDVLDIQKYEYITEPINDICPITRERFHNEQNVLMITSCKHIFNKSSLNRWLNSNNTCPSCRTAIRHT